MTVYETIEKISRDGAPSVWIETSGHHSAIEAAVAAVAKEGRISCTGLGEQRAALDMARVAFDSISLYGRWQSNTDCLLELVQIERTNRLKIRSTISHVLEIVL